MWLIVTTKLPNYSCSYEVVETREKAEAIVDEAICKELCNLHPNSVTNIYNTDNSIGIIHEAGDYCFMMQARKV